LEKLRSTGFRALPVLSDRGVEGMVSVESLQQTQASEAKTLSDLLAPDSFPHLHRDHTVAQALDRMAASRMDLLPVVSRANIRQIEGVITLSDVLARYGVSALKD